MAFARLENQTEPRVVSELDDWVRFTMLENVVEALKKLLPLKVLLLERSVEEAAVMVALPFALTGVPLMVARVPVR